MLGIPRVDLIGVRARLFREAVAQEVAGEREAGDDLRLGVEGHAFGRQAGRFALVSTRVDRAGGERFGTLFHLDSYDTQWIIKCRARAVNFADPAAGEMLVAAPRRAWR